MNSAGTGHESVFHSVVPPAESQVVEAGHRHGHRYEFLPEVIAIKVFDLAVNLGHKTAVMCLQRALHACGLRVAIDGRLGMETCGAAGQADQGALMAALRSEAAGEYRLRVARSADQVVFQGGWLNRAYA